MFFAVAFTVLFVALEVLGVLALSVLVANQALLFVLILAYCVFVPACILTTVMDYLTD